MDLVQTAGVFTLDGQSFDVRNNVWLVGDDAEVLVVDAAHDADAILDGVAGRRVAGIVCTHGHNDHISAAVDLARRSGAQIWLHPDDRMLWDAVHGERPVDVELTDGGTVAAGSVDLRVLHTPGHSPGGVCLYAPALDGRSVLFSGDTLFQGGPGATGRSYSDFDTIITSIRERLLTLPSETEVHPGHGASTTIGAEAPHLQEWIERGY
ncbi:MAG: MBL fold metallo-hydrolase [Actinomycetota bacterium]|nr:MBL fold metallo-hydrolase [Actinomycetota bacterium]